MIVEIEYKKKYCLYGADNCTVLGIFPSRQDAVEYNHRLTLARLKCVKLIEQHNAKYPGNHSLYKLN